MKSCGVADGVTLRGKGQFSLTYHSCALRFPSRSFIRFLFLQSIAPSRPEREERTRKQKEVIKSMTFSTYSAASAFLNSVFNPRFSSIRGERMNGMRRWCIGATFIRPYFFFTPLAPRSFYLGNERTIQYAIQEEKRREKTSRRYCLLILVALLAAS